MSANFLRIFQHLLPRSEAWKITIEKTLRDFFEGLTVFPASIKAFFDENWLELWTDTMTTSALTLWEQTHGLYPPWSGLGTHGRKLRVDAAWGALGGQDPTYLQTVIREHGFNDIYIHEWWEPGSDPPVARNPTAVLIGTVVECGEPGVECGEGYECGDFLTVASNTGWLVNKLTRIGRNYLYLCGEAGVECGEAGVECGEFDGYENVAYEWPIPDDPDVWPYFLYFGDSTFGDSVQIREERRDEFETLLLKYCPTEQWIGYFVEWTGSPPV
jgi:hypothetical protein